MRVNTAELHLSYVEPWGQSVSKDIFDMSQTARILDETAGLLLSELVSPASLEPVWSIPSLSGLEFIPSVTFAFEESYCDPHNMRSVELSVNRLLMDWSNTPVREMAGSVEAAQSIVCIQTHKTTSSTEVSWMKRPGPLWDGYRNFSMAKKTSSQHAAKWDFLQETSLSSIWRSTDVAYSKNRVHVHLFWT